MTRNLRSRGDRDNQTDAARAAAEAEAQRVAAEQEAARIAAETDAQNQNNGQVTLQAVLTMLAQVLERLPAVNPVGVGNPNGMGNENGGERAGPDVGVNEVVPERIPSYLTVLEHMQKLGTKFFRGAGDTKPVEADEWRARLERNFESIRCPEQYKKDIAVHYLDEDAHTWWKGASARLPNPNCSWETFSALFRTKYFPPEAYDRLEAAFLDLHQGSKTVREYEAEFNQLKKYAGKELEDENVQVRRFMRGLRVELRNGCLVRNFTSVGELVEKAAMLEAGLAEERKAKGGTNQTAVRAQGAGSNQNKKTGPSGMSPVEQSVCSACGNSHLGECRVASGACFRCGSLSHRVRDCPEEDTRNGSARVCSGCNEPGHILKDCPRQGTWTGSQKRANEGGQPAAKRQAIQPRIFHTSAVGEASESENDHPTTGESYH